MILHVVSYDVSRGAERYARALVDTLNGRGTDRHLLLTVFRGDEESLDADISLDVPRGVLRRLGFDPRAVRRLRRAIEETRPNAIVAHGGEPAKYAAIAARDVPYAYLIIGSSHPRLSNPLRRMMRDFYIKRATALVAVSSALADEVTAGTGGEPPVWVIPNGRDPAVYRPGDGGAGPVPHVLFIGHLEEQKRPLLFVRVMAAISQRGVPCSASIVGGGPLFDTVESEAAALDIRLLGPRDDVPELLSRSDLLVLTSRPPEGMPGVLIEAGMAGLPVVTTDVPGAREVVVDGSTGEIVGLDDEMGLIDAVAGLLIDPDRRKRMGAAARERCVSKFSLSASADAWVSVFEEMAG